MDRNQRKKFTRKNLSLKNRKDRFISSYIKAKFPDVYDQASKSYNQIDAAYPNKRDLTKTVEFVYTTTGVTTLNQYYHKKRSERVRKGKEAAINDNMVLNIPLFGTKDCIEQQQQQKQETNENELALPIPDELYNNLLEELRNDPDLHTILNDMDMPGEQSNESNLCEDIFTELNQDPALQAVLSNEQTPLERELSSLYY